VENCGMRLRNQKLIKGIAIFIICLFTWNNVVWANPNIIDQRSHLKPPNEFCLDEITDTLSEKPVEHATVQLLVGTLKTLHTNGAEKAVTRRTLSSLPTVAAVDILDEGYCFEVTLKTGAIYVMGYDSSDRPVFSRRSTPSSLPPIAGSEPESGAGDELQPMIPGSSELGREGAIAGLDQMQVDLRYGASYHVYDDCRVYFSSGHGNALGFSGLLLEAADTMYGKLMSGLGHDLIPRKMREKMVRDARRHASMGRGPPRVGVAKNCPFTSVRNITENLTLIDSEWLRIFQMYRRHTRYAKVVRWLLSERLFHEVFHARSEKEQTTRDIHYHLLISPELQKDIEAFFDEYEVKRSRIAQQTRARFKFISEQAQRVRDGQPIERKEVARFVGPYKRHIVAAGGQRFQGMFESLGDVPSDLVKAIEWLSDGSRFPVSVTAFALMGHAIASLFDKDKHWTRFAFATVMSYLTAHYIALYIGFIKYDISDMPMLAYSVKPVLDMLCAIPMVAFGFYGMGVRERLVATFGKEDIFTKEWMSETRDYLDEKGRLLFSEEGREGYLMVLMLYWMTIIHFTYNSDFSVEAVKGFTLPARPLFAVISAFFVNQRVGKKITSYAWLNKALHHSYFLPIAIVAIATVSLTASSVVDLVRFGPEAAKAKFILASKAAWGFSTALIGYGAYRALNKFAKFSLRRSDRKKAETKEARREKTPLKTATPEPEERSGRIYRQVAQEFSDTRSFRDVGFSVLGLSQPQESAVDMFAKKSAAVREKCALAEDDESTQKYNGHIDWEAINYLRDHRRLDPHSECVLHVLDERDAEGDSLFGFAASPEETHFSSLLPVISYVSEKDQRLHIFITQGFYEDFLQVSHILPSVIRRRIQTKRLAEVIDREVFIHSEQAQRLPLAERHRQAALRARYFAPSWREVSFYHKWVINNLVIAEQDRDYLMRPLEIFGPISQKREDWGYEEHFSHYAQQALARDTFPHRVHREAHHLFQAYHQGDREVFTSLCMENGIDAGSLSNEIEAIEARHVRNMATEFRTDVLVTGTYETEVAIDMERDFVRKAPKTEYTYLVEHYLLRSDQGRAYLKILEDGIREGTILYEGAVDYVFRAHQEFRGLPENFVGYPYSYRARIVRDIITDYMNRHNTEELNERQMATLAHYEQMREKLGGLIAEFKVVDNEIYQRRVTPIPQRLLEVANGTGAFEGTSFEERRRIGRDILRRCLDCMLEAAKRGIIIRDCKISSLGMRDDGEIVFVDLGPEAFCEMDSKEVGLVDYFLSSLGANTVALMNLGDAGTEEAKFIPHVEDEEMLERLRTEWRIAWSSLVNENEGSDSWRWRPKGSLAGFSSEALAGDETRVDGLTFARRIRDFLPETREQAEYERKRITFVPTEIAEEEMLRLIMQRVSEVQTQVVAAQPGRGDLSALWDRKITLEELVRNPFFDDPEVLDDLRRRERETGGLDQYSEYINYIRLLARARPDLTVAQVLDGTDPIAREVLHQVADEFIWYNHHKGKAGSFTENDPQIAEAIEFFEKLDRHDIVEEIKRLLKGKKISYILDKQGIPIRGHASKRWGINIVLRGVNTASLDRTNERTETGALIHEIGVMLGLPHYLNDRLERAYLSGDLGYLPSLLAQEITIVEGRVAMIDTSSELRVSLERVDVAVVSDPEGGLEELSSREIEERLETLQEGIEELKEIGDPEDLRLEADDLLEEAELLEQSVQAGFDHSEMLTGDLKERVGIAKAAIDEIAPKETKTGVARKRRVANGANGIQERKAQDIAARIDMLEAELAKLHEIGDPLALRMNFHRAHDGLNQLLLMCNKDREPDLHARYADKLTSLIESRDIILGRLRGDASGSALARRLTQDPEPLGTENIERVAQRLRMIVEQLGLSGQRQEIAKITGVNPDKVTKYLNGKQKASWPFIKKLAEKAGVDFGVVLFGRTLFRVLAETEDFNERLKRTREYLGLRMEDLQREFSQRYDYDVQTSTMTNYEKRAKLDTKFNPRYAKCLAEIAGMKNPAMLLFRKPSIAAEMAETPEEEQIRKFRIYLGYRQEEAAALFDHNQTWFSKRERWENPEQSRLVLAKLRQMAAIAYLAAQPSKDVGGHTATKQSADDALKEWTKEGRVVKLRLADGIFYQPVFIEDYTGIPGEDYRPERALQSPIFILSPSQIKRLRGYLKRSGIDPNAVTIGIVKGETRINPAGDDAFSIVHAGESTRTIWFGELLLKDILSRDEDRDAIDIFAHDVKHLTNPEEAEKEHGRLFPNPEYTALVERVNERCDRITSELSKIPSRRLKGLYERAALVRTGGRRDLAATLSGVSLTTFQDDTNRGVIADRLDPRWNDLFFEGTEMVPLVRLRGMLEGVAIEEASGDLSKAARLLGTTRDTLKRHIESNSPEEVGDKRLRDMLRCLFYLDVRDKVAALRASGNHISDIAEILNIGIYDLYTMLLNDRVDIVSAAPMDTYSDVASFVDWIQENRLKSLSDAALCDRTNELRSALEDGRSLSGLLPEAFAVVKEAARRKGERADDPPNLAITEEHICAAVALHKKERPQELSRTNRRLAIAMLTYLDALGGQRTDVDKFYHKIGYEDSRVMRAIFNFLRLRLDIADVQAPKDLGGPGATKQSADDAIVEWIRQGRVIKCHMGSNLSYVPALKEGTEYEGTFSDIGHVLGHSFFTGAEIKRLCSYLTKHGISPNEVTIGVIRGEAFVNPADDGTFTIVHAGESTRTIWFGELLLRDLLKKEQDRHAEYIFGHDVRHITNPDEAQSHHATKAYRQTRSAVRRRCKRLEIDGRRTLRDQVLSNKSGRAFVAYPEKAGFRRGRLEQETQWCGWFMDNLSLGLQEDLRSTHREFDYVTGTGVSAVPIAGYMVDYGKALLARAPELSENGKLLLLGGACKKLFQVLRILSIRPRESAQPRLNIDDIYYAELTRVLKNREDNRRFLSYFDSIGLYRDTRPILVVDDHDPRLIEAFVELTQEHNGDIKVIEHVVRRDGEALVGDRAVKIDRFLDDSPRFRAAVSLENMPMGNTVVRYVTQNDLDKIAEDRELYDRVSKGLEVETPGTLDDYVRSAQLFYQRAVYGVCEMNAPACMAQSTVLYEYIRRELGLQPPFFAVGLSPATEVPQGWKDFVLSIFNAPTTSIRAHAYTREELMQHIGLLHAEDQATWFAQAISLTLDSLTNEGSLLLAGGSYQLSTAPSAAEAKRFVDSLRTLAEEARDRDEELAIAFDTNIGNLQDYAEGLFSVLRELQEGEGLENLRIFAAEGTVLRGQLRQYLRKANTTKTKTRVVTLAKRENVERRIFSSLEDEVQIISVDDSRLLSGDGKILRQPIPVTRMIERAAQDRSLKELILEAQEDAAPVEGSEIRRRYQEEAEFIRNV